MSGRMPAAEGRGPRGARRSLDKVDPHAIKVLYISGAGRSGTTVLSAILGELQGFFFAGELVQLWAKLGIPGWLCGCGEGLEACEVWRGVRRAYPDVGDQRVAALMAGSLRGAIRAKKLPLALTPGGQTQLFPPEVTRRLESLYRAIALVTRARVIVDTSKTPAYGRALQLLPKLEVYVLHIVRDPRAVAFSWSRHKRHDSDGGEDSLFRLSRLGPANAALRWTAANAQAEAFWAFPKFRGYLRVRYEDFIRRPDAILPRIIDLVDEESRPLAMLEGSEVRLGVNHSVAGNPNRHKGGLIQLREDREWENRMTRRDRAVVTGLTSPLLARYGYLGAKA